MHLGVAVALEDGLIVPVIRDAQRLSVEGLAERIKDLATRARANTLGPDEVRGGTFTITNPGGAGSIIATPVINQPQVAILDTEAVVKRPVVITDADGNDSDRHPPDELPVHVLGPPCAGRHHRGRLPAGARRPAGGVELTGRS